ncbi:MAG: Rossmann-like domain-containing protein [Bacillota bacterium]
MQKMKLIDDLIKAESRNSAAVKDVRVGVTWTGVWGKHCGLAKTYGVPVAHGNYTQDLGKLTKKSTLQLAEYAKSWNLIEASIGVAAINAMVEPKGEAGINALDLIVEWAKNKRVTMVGSFPRTQEIRSAASDFKILELDPAKLNPKKGIIPATAADYLLPVSDLAIITGSTLINKSLRYLLELTRRGDVFTVLLGPSTLMSEVFFDYGVNMLAGAEIIKPEPILNKISQSGGMVNSRVCAGEILYRVLER